MYCSPCSSWICKNNITFVQFETAIECHTYLGWSVNLKLQFTDGIMIKKHVHDYRYIVPCEHMMPLSFKEAFMHS